MPEEERTESEQDIQSQEGQASSAENSDNKSSESQDQGNIDQGNIDQGNIDQNTNYEQKYKDTQAKLTEIAEENARNKELIEAIDPYVDWDRANDGGDSGSREEESSDANEPVSQKKLDQRLQQFETKMTIRELTADFRSSHPELKPYEDLVGFNLVNKTDKKKSIQDRMSDAIGLTQQFLEAERKKGTEAATQKATENAAAGGLGSAGTSTPKKTDEDKGQSYDDYIAARKKQRLAKT